MSPAALQKTGARLAVDDSASLTPGRTSHECRRQAARAEPALRTLRAAPAGHRPRLRIATRGARSRQHRHHPDDRDPRRRRDRGVPVLGGVLGRCHQRPCAPCCRRRGLGRVRRGVCAHDWAPPWLSSGWQSAPSRQAVRLCSRRWSSHSSLVPIVISLRLALFRRLLTPTIVGTVNMLVPATVLPVVFGRLTEGTRPAAAELGAPLTAPGDHRHHQRHLAEGERGAASVGAPRRGRRRIGGCGLRGPLRSGRRVAAAPWIGLPPAAWPGVELDPGPAFVALLPAFVFVAVIGTIQTITGGRRHPAGVVAPAAGGGLPGRAGSGGRRRRRQAAVGRRRHHADPDHRRERAHHRADGGRRPRGRRRRRGPADRAGAAAQAARPGPGDTGPRRGGLSDRGAGDELRTRHDGDRAGRDRPPQGDDRGRRVLGRRRLPETA